MKLLTGALSVALLFLFLSASAMPAAADEQAPTSLQELHVAVEKLNDARNAELRTIFAKMDQELSYALKTKYSWPSGRDLSDNNFTAVSDAGVDRQIQQCHTLVFKTPEVVAAKMSMDDRKNYMSSLSEKMNLTAEQQKDLKPIVDKYLTAASEKYTAYEKQKTDLTNAYLEYQRKLRESH